MSKGPGYYVRPRPKEGDQPPVKEPTAIVIEGRLSSEAQKFCEQYLATGEIERSVRDSGIEVGLRSRWEVGEEILSMPIVRDHMAMISPDTPSTDMEVSISRLEIVRRMAWRRNDVRLVKDIEMEIAKLRGWIVEKKLIATGGMKEMEGVGYKELAIILTSEAGRRELERQGLDIQKLLPHTVVDVAH